MAQHNVAAQPALVFIPDISGFTEFVKATEIGHARHIIEELLEKLIAANEIKLTISEIEGDAILFYRYGAAPSAEELFEQVRKMFLAFHGHLRLYEVRRICHCGACSAAQNLKLKFVAHYGSITETRIRDHRKLFGEDVIAAHRVLKNSVDSSDYVLWTEALHRAWSEPAFPPWLAPAAGSDQYDLGEIRYSYGRLESLRQSVPKPQPADIASPAAMQALFSCEQRIGAPMDQVFGVATDLPSRVHWVKGVKEVKLLNDKLNRAGTRHRCISDENIPELVTGVISVTGDLLAFSENDPKKMACAVYTFRRLGPAETLLRIEFFIRKSLLAKILFGLMKAKMRRNMQVSAANLSSYCERHARSATA